MGLSFGYAETRNVEIFTIYDIKDRGLLLQPKFSVSPEDAFEIEFGYILYNGTDESVFGRFEKNDQVYLKGDVVTIPPDVVHWHGAAPESHFVHIGMSTKVHLGPASWSGPVTDEEYSEATGK
jgi:hypothetical protein